MDGSTFFLGSSKLGRAFHETKNVRLDMIEMMTGWIVEAFVNIFAFLFKIVWKIAVLVVKGLGLCITGLFAWLISLFSKKMS